MVKEFIIIIRSKTLTTVLVVFLLAMGSTSAFAQADASSGSVVDPYQEYSYENMLTDAAELQAQYPELIRTKNIGKSVEERDLVLIELGNGDRKIFLCGATHAREYITTSYLMYMIDRYASAYSKGEVFGGYDIVKILSDVTFYIVPMVNPDGVNLVQNGINSVKDYATVSKILINPADSRGYTSWKANVRGVDLNKNFPYSWYGSTLVSVPASSSFKGYSPLSEPETKAIKDFLNSNMCWAYITFHSQGEGLYGWDDANAGYYPQLYSMVSRIIENSGFKKLSDAPGMNYGSFAEYVRKTYLKPALTIELCKRVGSYPYPNEDFDSVWAPARNMSLIVAEEVMKMKPQDYRVYQNSTFLHAFSDVKYALAYARKWENSKILFVKGTNDQFESIVPSDLSVYLNDSNLTFQAYNVDGSNYIKLRDLAAALLGTDNQFEVGYDSMTNAIILTSEAAYTAIGEIPAVPGPVSLRVMPSNVIVYLDDAQIDLNAYNIGGNNYFNLSDMGSALDLSITYE